MPITSSAKKALRSSLRKRTFNLRKKRAIETATKKIKKLITAKKSEEALAAMPEYQKALDKAVKTNFLKKNTAARKKSRMISLIRRNSS